MLIDQLQARGRMTRGFDFGDAARNAVRAAFCAALRTAQGVGEAINLVFVGAGGGQGISPKTNVPRISALICNEPAPRFPPSVQFPKGGQCGCVAYRLQGYLTRTTAAANLSFTTTVWGPVIGFVPIETSVGRTGYSVRCRGIATATCASGIVSVDIGSGDSGGTIAGIVVTSIRRVDGQPDNCGDPRDDDPIDWPPTGIPVVGPPAFYPPDGGNLPDVSFSPIVVFFKPELDANLNVNIPFTLNTDINIGAGATLSLSGTLNLNTGDVTFNFNGGDRPSLPIGNGNCDNPVEPVRPLPEPGGGGKPKPEDDDVEDDTVIVGVAVRVSSISPTVKASTIFQSGNPDIYAPSLGHVSFFITDSNGAKLGWTTDIPVKNKEQFIPCPYEYGASGVSGSPQPGVSWSLTPIRRKVPRAKT